MIRFAHSEYLYLLLLLPGILALFFIALQKRRNMLRLYGNPTLLQTLMRSRAKYKPLLKFTLLVLAMLFLVLALANPQVGTKMEEVKREGVDAIIALDVSNSMKAEDIRPDRLEHAKRNIAQMLEKLENDRIGMIVFAGDSYLQLPLTTDYSAVRLVLGTIDVDIVPVQGTAIGSAIKLARESFVAGEKKYKVLIIVSDGENHEDDAVDAAREAREEGITIHTIGMGSPEGAPIPVYQNNVRIGFKKDANGEVVVSRLNEDALKEIAEKGGGMYVRAANQKDEFGEIYAQIAGMEKKEFGARVVTEYEDRFQYFLGLALLCFVCEFFVSERRTNWAFVWRWMGRKS